MVAKQLDEETVKKVIRQVEFYFTNCNLGRDNFLKNTIAESEDVVSLALICSFSQMRGHLELGDAKAEDVPEDIVEAVAATLKNSTTVEISEDGKKVGRTTELRKVEEAIEQLDCRTIAASPFEYDINVEDVKYFFGHYAKVKSVRLPRHVADKGVFCGTALVEFSSEEDATKILTQSLVFEGAELELIPKKKFDEKRAKEEEAEETRRSMLPKCKNGSQEEDYPKGLIVEFELESTSKDSSAEKTDGKTESMEVATEEGETKAGVKNEEGEDEKKSSESEEKEKTETKKMSADMYKDNKDVVLYEDLKTVFEEFGTVKDIFKTGDHTGYIEFEDAKASVKARIASLDALRGGLRVKNCIASLCGVKADTEKEYWDKKNFKDVEDN